MSEVNVVLTDKKWTRQKQKNVITNEKKNMDCPPLE